VSQVGKLKELTVNTLIKIASEKTAIVALTDMRMNQTVKLRVTVMTLNMGLGNEFGINR
jgi:hypothetical protein